MSEYIESGTTHFFAALKEYSEGLLSVATLGANIVRVAAAKGVVTGTKYINKSMRIAGIRTSIEKLTLSGAADGTNRATAGRTDCKLVKDANELGLLATEAKFLLSDVLAAMDEFDAWFSKARNEPLPIRIGMDPRQALKYEFINHKEAVQNKIKKCRDKFDACVQLLNKIVTLLSQEQKEFAQYKRDMDQFANSFSAIDRII